MLVSVIADASYCDEYKIAGLACWVKSNRTQKGVFRKGVRSDPRIVSSTLAELGAVVMGVHVAVKTKVAHYGDTVLIQSDCTGVFPYIVYPKTKLGSSQVEDEMIEVLMKYSTDYGLRYRYKHVKGHQNGSMGGRFAVNIRCDAEAYKAMKSRRLKMIKELENVPQPHSADGAITI